MISTHLVVHHSNLGVHCKMPNCSAPVDYLPCVTYELSTCWSEASFFLQLLYADRGFQTGQKWMVQAGYIIGRDIQHLLWKRNWVFVAIATSANGMWLTIHYGIGNVTVCMLLWCSCVIFTHLVWYIVLRVSLTKIALSNQDCLASVHGSG